MALLDQLEDPRQERYCRGSCLSGVACGGGRRSDIGRGRRGARAMPRAEPLFMAVAAMALGAVSRS
jgi:hypothetical protein